MVDGVLYPTSPDNVWAVDARDGTILWQYYWKTRGGTHTGHRGVGMWHELPLHRDARRLPREDRCADGQGDHGASRSRRSTSSTSRRWRRSSSAITSSSGTGNDLDAPGYLQSYDPETGKRQWILYTVPMNPGDPGVETWPSLDAARHGGAQPWVPGVYDPETHLYIFGTGNPTPAYTPAGRGDGVGLFTCSLVAVNVDTGKMAWYYQTSPRDMHDWDSAQTPILIDTTINGRPRKLVSTAARNGYFFTVDRITGEHVASGKFSLAANWASGLDDEGPADPQPREGRDHSRRDRQRQRDELAAARVLAGHRALLRAREQQSVDPLPDRRRSARIDGPRRRAGRRRRARRATS